MDMERALRGLCAVMAAALGRLFAAGWADVHRIHPTELLGLCFPGEMGPGGTATGVPQEHLPAVSTMSPSIAAALMDLELHVVVLSCCLALSCLWLH